MNFTNFPKVLSKTVDMKIIFFRGSSPVVYLLKCLPWLFIHLILSDPHLSMALHLILEVSR